MAPGYEMLNFDVHLKIPLIRLSTTFHEERGFP